ncbi:hypothetical protein AB0M43_37160 [Longispora sp. NPDC051575]|uniref:hypothetical protein n=1 Tax=Longispora sp. NPDC051575 TaxID=3154943 RepID=UPI003420867F
MPSNDRTKLERKKNFVATLLAAVEQIPTAQQARLVLAGDINSVRRDHQPAHRFLPFEYDFHDRLEALGLTDLHRLVNPGVQEHSWFGRGGAGYQYDYLYAGTALHDAARTCAYDQQPRLDRLTDHAALSAALDLPIPASQIAPPANPAATLF